MFHQHTSATSSVINQTTLCQHGLRRDSAIHLWPRLSTLLQRPFIRYLYVLVFVCLTGSFLYSPVTGSDETVTITVVSENWTTIVKTFPQTRRQIAIRLSHDDLPFDSIQLVTTDVVQQVKPILICEIGDTRVCSEERHPVRFDATIPDEELRKYRIQQYRIFAEGFISIREVSLCLLIEIDGNTFIVHPLHDNIHQITFGQNEFVRNFLSDISHSFTTNRLITKRSTSEEIRYCGMYVSFPLLA